MCVFALTGSIECDSGVNVRLPVDVCRRIEELGILEFRSCTRCSTLLLTQERGVLFSPNLSTTWQVSNNWLLANRENTLIHERLTSQEDLPADCIVFKGDSGLVTVKKRSEFVAFVLSPTNIAVFENTWSRLRQRNWYKRIGDTFACRNCFWTLRKKRAFFDWWTTKHRLTV